MLTMQIVALVKAKVDCDLQLFDEYFDNAINRHNIQ